MKLIVTGVAGSAIDLVTRALADKLSAALKQSFIVEDRPGAGGNLGAEVVARAAPDGHTLLVALDTTLTVNPSLYSKLPFDPEIRFPADRNPGVVEHHAGRAPFRSGEQRRAISSRSQSMRRCPMRTAATARPAISRWNISGCWRNFRPCRFPIEAAHQLVGDLVGGQIKLGFVSTATVLEHVRAGRLKGLAISAGRRAPMVPDIPTMVEAGYPGFRVELYYVMLGPARMPDFVATLLEREVAQALKAPDFQDRFRAQDIAIDAITGDTITKRLTADRALWAKVAKAADMRVE